MTINSGLTDSELVAAVQKAHGTNVVYDNVSWIGSGTPHAINTAPNSRTLLSIFWDGAQTIQGVLRAGVV